MAEEKLVVVEKTINTVKELALNPNGSKFLIASLGSVGGFMTTLKEIFSKRNNEPSKEAFEILEKLEKDQAVFQELIQSLKYGLKDALAENEELQKQLEAKNKEVREELNSKGHSFTDNSVNQIVHGEVKGDVIGGNKIIYNTAPPEKKK